jgi:outer membrane protein OmpA-like peptidoglycan-associated protein
MKRHSVHLVALGIALILTTSIPLLSAIPASATGFHAITFEENDSSSDQVYAYQTEDTSTSLTLFSNLSPSFSNPGESFVDWNTEPDGSGVTYSDGEIYSFDAPIDLYAIWAAPYSTVTFEENDSPSDSAYAWQTEDESSALTSFASLSPSFSNPGYTFNGWNTAANGSGTTYANGSSYSFAADVDLYAQWITEPTVTASFDDNGGSGYIAPIVDPSGTTITLPATGSLTRADFALSGWNTAANGSGTESSPGASVPLVSTGTYFAQWTETSPLVVQFADNGGTGSDVPLSGNEGTTITLPGSTGLTEAGFTLTSWNTAANGSGVSYGLGQSLVLTEPLTLYAQWTASATSITISFAANGGSGSLSELSGASGTSVTLPGATSIVRPGFSLTSWNSVANGSGTSYSLGESLTLTSTLTLYAQWKSVPTSRLFGAIGLFAGRTTGLTPALEKQVRSLATTIKTRKYTKVLLFGFSAATGVASLDHSLSAARASNVANYLRDELRSMKVGNVGITMSGQGSVDGSKNASNSRVEVFVT